MKKEFVFSIIAISIIIIFNQTTYAQSEPITSKIWFITSNENGCSTKNYKAILFLQSIAYVYLSIYGVESQFSPPQCLYLTDFENSQKKLSNSMNNFDLPIIILNSEEKSNRFFSTSQSHHLQLIDHFSPHIVLCYCAIPSVSHTASWAISHQLSHFILNYKGESEHIFTKWVHDTHNEALECIETRKQPGVCVTRWTPVFGLIPKEMMTVKVHPKYFRELESLEQMTISKQVLSYEKPSHEAAWINQIEVWYKNGLISKTEFENFLKFISKFDFKNNLDEKKDQLSTGKGKTILKLNPFNKIEGGKIIIFSGTLSTQTGQKIENEIVLIKSDVGCPADGIIAQGKTDKNGKFLIKKIAEDWSKNNNRMKISAEFLGNEKFDSSTSRTFDVLINSGIGQNCHFIHGIS